MLLNIVHTKKHIKEQWKRKRGCGPRTHVTKQAIEQLEYALMRLIDREIMKHPSRGVTFDIPMGSCGEAK